MKNHIIVLTVQSTVTIPYTVCLNAKNKSGFWPQSIFRFLTIFILNSYLLFSQRRLVFVTEMRCIFCKEGSDFQTTFRWAPGFKGLRVPANWNTLLIRLTARDGVLSHVTEWPNCPNEDRILRIDFIKHFRTLSALLFHVPLTYNPICYAVQSCHAAEGSRLTDPRAIPSTRLVYIIMKQVAIAPRCHCYS